MSYSNYEQTVVLNGYALSGVQSVEGSYGIAEKPVRVAGVGFIDALIDAPLQGNFSISRTMVSADPLLEVNALGKYIFDEAELEGAILYDNQTKGFGFNQARISRYSVSCSVGQMPEIQTDLTIYGKLGKEVFPGLNYAVNTSSEFHPFDSSEASFVFFNYEESTYSDFFDITLTSDTPSQTERNSIYLEDALDLDSLGNNWYESTWFIVSKQDSSSDAIVSNQIMITEDIEELKKSWAFSIELGWIYLATTEQPIKAVWVFKQIITPVVGGDSVWFHFADHSTSQGLAYMRTETTATGPEGWIAFFPDAEGEYGLIYYNAGNGLWYGLKTGGEIELLSSFAGGRDILSEENKIELWNNESLKISNDQYASLKETTLSQYNSSVLYLGKDAFSLPSDYSEIINKDHPPIKFPDQSTIKVKVSDFSIDAISDFSYTRTLNLNPVYAIPRGTERNWNSASDPDVKNLQPVQVDTQYPIETDINFTMIANEYEIREIKDRIQSAPKSNVEIEIRDAQSNEMINSFTGQNVRLIGESISSSIQGEMSISLTYKGYDTLHNPVS